MQSQSNRGTGQEVIFQRDRAAIEMLLNRPETLNALNDTLLKDISGILPDLARDTELYAVIIRSTAPWASCIGGDISELFRIAKYDIAQARRRLAQTYTLVWRLDCLPKPMIAFIEGAVMGTAVGLIHFCTHRVAAQGYKFAVPQIAYGFFPDAGIAHILANLPHCTGFYLALTGRTINRADAYALGIATHSIETDEFSDIIASLADAQPIDPLVDSRHLQPGDGELAAHYECLAETFSAPNIDELVMRLKSKRAGYHTPEWIDAIIADLGRHSPIALAVTLRHLQRCKGLDLRANLIADYTLACNILQSDLFHDSARFYDRIDTTSEHDGDQPLSRYSTPSHVSHETVEQLFSSGPQKLEPADRNDW